MAFICYKCQAAQLNIISSIQLPPDGYSDDVTLQIIECDSCGFSGLATYEESRHGSFDSFHHSGYLVSAEVLNNTRKLMLQCPNRQNRQCLCVAHQMFSHQNERGEWDWINSIQHTRQFHLKLASA